MRNGCKKIWMAAPIVFFFGQFGRRNWIVFDNEVFSFLTLKNSFVFLFSLGLECS